MKAVFVCCAIAACGMKVSAAPFQNLGFDDANTNNISLTQTESGVIGSGPVTDLLPGWQLLKGTNAVSTLGFDLLTGTSYETLLSATGSYPNIVEGACSLALHDPSNVPYSLIQWGTVPVDAQVLSYKYYGDAFNVQINDQMLPPLLGNLSRSTYGNWPLFDISAFSG